MASTAFAQLGDEAYDVPQALVHIDMSREAETREKIRRITNRPDFQLLKAFVSIQNPSNDVWLNVVSIIDLWKRRRYRLMAYWPIMVTNGQGDYAVL